MNSNDLHEVRWFRSQPISLAGADIDVDNGIIRNVVMVQEGEAKGHGLHLEGEFIEEITAYDIKHFFKRGLKARFGHPGASSETMGTQLGVFYNFSIREKGGRKEEIADLHLLESADMSPTHPNMRQWVINMAQERPDFIMSSIVFRAGSYYQKDEKGKKQYVWTYDQDGNWVRANSKMKVYVEFGSKGEHYYTDIVEAGAATERLFSNEVNKHLYVVQVEDFLDQHPEIHEFLKSNPEAVQRWLKKAGYSVTNTHSKKMKFSLKEWLLGADNTEPAADDLQELRTALNEARDEIKQLRAERDAFKHQYETAFASASQLANEAQQLREQVEQLSAQITGLNQRLSVVEKSPAAEATGGEPEGGAQPRKYGQDPINQEAAALFARVRKA